MVKRRKMRRAAAAFMAAVMVAAMVPSGGIAYGDMILNDGAGNVSEKEIEIRTASDADEAYVKESDSNAEDKSSQSVKVNVKKAEIATQAYEPRIHIAIGGTYYNYAQSEMEKVAQLSEKISVAQEGDVWKISLHGITAEDKLARLHFEGGNWKIEIEGENVLNSAGIKVKLGAQVEITGGGSLDIAGDSDGGIYVSDGELTVNMDEGGVLRSRGEGKGINIVQGKLTVNGGSVCGYTYSNYSIGIVIRKDGEFTVNGGTVTTAQPGKTDPVEKKTDLSLKGNLQINGGVFEILNSLEQGSTDADSTGNIDIYGKLQVKGKWNLKGGAQTTIYGGGKVETAAVEIGEGTSFTLEENGSLILKGKMEEAGTEDDTLGKFIDNGGTITLGGKGEMPTRFKEKIEIKTVDPLPEYIVTNQIYDVTAFFVLPDGMDFSKIKFTKGDDSPISIYSYINKFMAYDAGTCKIWAEYPEDPTTQKASAYVELPILRTQKSVVAKAYNGVYDGESHDAVIIENQPEGTKVRYRKEGEGEFKDDCPQLKDCKDSGAKFEVEISGDKYVTETYLTSNAASIKPASLWDAEIRISGDFVYNGQMQQPSGDQVQVILGERIIPQEDYKIDYGYYENQYAGDGAWLRISPSISQNGNYYGGKNASFTIKPAPLTISGGTIEEKVYDGTTDAKAASVEFSGLCGEDQLSTDDYEISANFTDADAGTGKTVLLTGKLKNTFLARNYELSPEPYELKDQVIAKAEKPELKNIYVSYRFNEKGKRSVDITGLPDDIGTYFGAAAEVSSDEIQALGKNVTVDGTKVTFELLGNEKENVGKTSEVLVKNIATQNYEDAEFKIVVTMEPKKDQSEVSSQMTFTPNGDDETFTAEIAAVDGAEYSFDGETWSDTNKKYGCFADTSYTGYIRMKETEELYAGPETAVAAVSPRAYAKTPVITPAGGSFWGKQKIVIESATKDAKIYYTLDGTDPTTESGLYTAPFELREKATIKAIAVKEHLENSDTASAEFTKNYSSSDSDDYEPETGKGTSGKGNTAGAANSANTDKGTITNDTVKGVVSSVNGVITGAANSTADDGYSHWMQDEKGWWLRYSDGSYPKGTKNGSSGSDTSYGWEKINGAWWAFDENGYMSSGWLFDAAFGGWFYVNGDHGMQTGWVLVDGKWYYLNPVSDGRRGVMYKGTKTPDGWYVGEDGSWDGLAKQ